MLIKTIILLMLRKIKNCIIFKDLVNKIIKIKCKETSNSMKIQMQMVLIVQYNSWGNKKEQLFNNLWEQEH
jgi:hypothetical protein